MLGISLFVFSAIQVFVMIFSLYRLFSAVVFFIMMLLGGGILGIYGKALSFDKEGIHKWIFGYHFQMLPWNEVKEVGITGTKVFHGDNAQKCGTLYLYFSKKKMTQESRFKMILEWPARDEWFLRYSEERFASVQMYWEKPIERYNVGEKL